jgi:hypothetical protein
VIYERPKESEKTHIILAYYKYYVEREAISVPIILHRGSFEK